MSDDTDATPTVACTLTPEQIADRTGELRALTDGFLGAEAVADGYTFRFEGADEVFEAVAAFVANERQCCPFADYALETTPPYDEARLTVTGPEGTKAMFGEGLLELLTAASE